MGRPKDRLLYGERLLLGVLCLRGETRGRDLVKQGPRGTYALLDQLEQKGLVSSREETQETPSEATARRCYRITEPGLQMVASGMVDEEAE